MVEYFRESNLILFEGEPMKHDAISEMDPQTLGKRLQIARMAAGLRQQDVAENLKLARTTITAIEQGQRQVRPGELVKMARLYGRAVSDLVGRRPVIADFAVQLRSVLTDRKDEQDLEPLLAQAILEFQSLCENHRQLEIINEYLSSRSYPPPVSRKGLPTEVSAAAISSAERNRLGIGDGPLVHLRDVLENEVGLRVFFIPLASSISGMFAYTDELGGCIAVNLKHPRERQHWTLAHEYGHFLTERYRANVVSSSGSLGTKSYRRARTHELFADAFARNFLMPEAGLRRRFLDLKQAGSDSKFTMADVCRLAASYLVSVQAMTLRLEELQLLHRGTWDRLTTRGFRVQEAHKELNIKKHSNEERLFPTDYQYLAVRAYKREMLTEGQLTNFLRCTRIEARQIVQEKAALDFLTENGEVETILLDLESRVSS